MEPIPFNQKEIDNATSKPGMFPGMPDIKVFDYPISPKENYRLVYQHKIPLWLPSFSDQQLFAPRIDPDNIARVQVFEANMLAPEEMTGCPDKFGIPWVFVPITGGSMVEPGNPALKDANDWPDVIKFPDVANWDWAGSAAANKEWVKMDKWLSLAFVTGFFERLISFMDFDGAAMALVDPDQKAAVHSLFNALVECYCDIIGRAYNAYPFDCIWFHDDWGAQRAPFFSLDLAMEMIVPYIKRVREFCHSLGIYFDMHSCGKNDLLVPAYLEIGADSWSGQDMNDKATIYEKYGDKIILGIEPDIPFNLFDPKPIALEDAKASADRFIAKYIPNYAKKPVLMGFFFGPEGFDDYMYRRTREELYKIATA